MRGGGNSEWVFFWVWGTLRAWRKLREAVRIRAQQDTTREPHGQTHGFARIHINIKDADFRKLRNEDGNSLRAICEILFDNTIPCRWFVIGVVEPARILVEWINSSSRVLILPRVLSKHTFATKLIGLRAGWTSWETSHDAVRSGDSFRGFFLWIKSYPDSGTFLTRNQIFF
jgi:hypothetical protein